MVYDLSYRRGLQKGLEIAFKIVKNTPKIKRIKSILISNIALAKELVTDSVNNK